MKMENYVIFVKKIISQMKMVDAPFQIIVKYQIRENALNVEMVLFLLKKQNLVNLYLQVT